MKTASHSFCEENRIKSRHRPLPKEASRSLKGYQWVGPRLGRTDNLQKASHANSKLELKEIHNQTIDNRWKDS